MTYRKCERPLSQQDQSIEEELYGDSNGFGLHQAVKPGSIWPNQTVQGAIAKCIKVFISCQGMDSGYNPATRSSSQMGDTCLNQTQLAKQASSAANSNSSVGSNNSQTRNQFRNRGMRHQPYQECAHRTEGHCFQCDQPSPQMSYEKALSANLGGR